MGLVTSVNVMVDETAEQKSGHVDFEHPINHTVLYVWSLKFARIVFSPQQHTTKQLCCECKEISAIYRQCIEIYR